MGHVKFSVGVAILGVLYLSTAYCDKSSIFNILRSNYKSDSSVPPQNSNPSSSSGKYPVHQGDVSTLRRKLSKNNNVGVSNSTELSTGNKNNSTGTGRDFFLSGGGGGGSNNLDLYSLLGGLAFLGLLASLFVFFSNRTTTPAITIIGRRKRDLNNDMDDDDLLGETFSEFLSNLGLTLENPWWNFWNGESQVDKKNIVPFKLI